MGFSKPQALADERLESSAENESQQGRAPRVIFRGYPPRIFLTTFVGLGTLTVGTCTLGSGTFGSGTLGSATLGTVTVGVVTVTPPTVTLCGCETTGS